MIKQRDQHTAFPLSIERFRAGLVTNRDPLQTPLRVQALQAIPLYDALIDGLNTEISPRMTITRAPGFPQYCSAAVTGTPLGFSQFRRTGNSPYLLLDTTSGVYQFTTSAINSLYSKGSGKTRFQQGGTTLYCCDGTVVKKIDSSLNVTGWGITAPSTAPSVANVASVTQAAWAASTFYNPSLLLVDSNSNLQLLTTPGTTGGSQPSPWATTAGSTTNDGSAVWTCQGTAARQTSHVYAANSYIAVNYTKTITYQVYNPATHQYQTRTGSVNYSDFFKTTSGGTSSSTATGSISWAPGIGSQVTDGTVTWVNQGTQITWSTIGATTLVATDAYIVDSNGNQQTPTKAGKSGGSAPTWSTVLNGVTTDSGTSWTNGGPLSAANSLPWSYVFVFTNSSTGHISSASSVSADIFLATNSNIAVSGSGSGDAQVDQVQIYRTKQGGSVYYFLGQVANPGSGVTWSFIDTVPDALLNTELIVTTVPLNNPPPSGTSLVAFYQGRLWVASGNNLYFDGGGDIINGVAHECFPPANVFPYLTNITALVPTDQGLVVFLEDEIHAVLGGPQTLTYYDQTIMQGVGVKSQDAVTQDQDQIFFLSSQGQGFVMSSSNFGEFGLAVADTLAANFAPSSSYIAKHRNGTDSGIFLSDGSANFMRFDQVNDRWSVLRQPVGGVGPIASLETSSGVFSLVTTIGGYVCSRSFSSFTDGHAASTYTAYATVGSLEVASLTTEPAKVSHAIARSNNAGSKPSVSILPNNTSGTFVNVPFTANLPAYLAGTSLEPTTVRQSRYDLSGATGLAYGQLNHLQIKVSWPSENNQNELTGLFLRN